jgi:NADPH:quinone reductase-like Zn-dependent oxidoreductase
VAEVAPGVTRVKPGDRVAGLFMPDWIAGGVNDAIARTARGAFAGGVLSETAVYAAEALVPAPAHLSFEEAATLPCAGVTAWNALVVSGRIRAGDTVLAIGTGGVSAFAIQLARLHGARVIVISSSDEKLTKARALGAEEGVNYRSTPDWEDPVRKWAGAGVDHVVEVGGATLNRSLRAVRTGGHIALIGVVAGAAEAGLAPAFMRSVRIQGIFVGSREMFEAMNRAIAASAMRPVVDRVFAMTGIRDALHAMESGAHFGKIVVRV